MLCYWDVQGQVDEGRLPMLEADLDWLDLLGVGPEGGGSSVYLIQHEKLMRFIINIYQRVASGHTPGLRDSASRECREIRF